jgi:hypothetical protein
MPILPEDKEKLLEYEAFIKEVMAQREGAAKSGGPPKPVWQRFLETTGGTALITVLIGGIMGSIITGIIQINAKTRETLLTQATARNNQAQVAYKEYLDKELEIVNRAFDLVGSCISASEDVIAVTTPEYDPDTYTEPENKKAVIKQQAEALGKYNEIDEKWRSEENKIGLLMNYYHHGQSEVGTGWQRTQEEVTKYMKCANEIYLLHLKGPVTEDKYKACEQQKQNLINQLRQLNQSLVITRPYLWEDGTAPQ